MLPCSSKCPITVNGLFIFKRTLYLESSNPGEMILGLMGNILLSCVCVFMFKVPLLLSEQQSSAHPLGQKKNQNKP